MHHIELKVLIDIDNNDHKHKRNMYIGSASVQGQLYSSEIAEVLISEYKLPLVAYLDSSSFSSFQCVIRDGRVLPSVRIHANESYIICVVGHNIIDIIILKEISIILLEYASNHNVVNVCTLDLRPTTSLSASSSFENDSAEESVKKCIKLMKVDLQKKLKLKDDNDVNVEITTTSSNINILDVYINNNNYKFKHILENCILEGLTGCIQLSSLRHMKNKKLNVYSIFIPVEHERLIPSIYGSLSILKHIYLILDITMSNDMKNRSKQLLVGMHGNILKKLEELTRERYHESIFA